MPEYIEASVRMSQAVIHGDTIYLAGQVGSPDTGLEEQTLEIFEKIEKLLQDSGSSKDHLLSVTIWLADMSDFASMNELWDQWISGHPAPARATGEVKLASAAYRIEITVVAAKA